MKHGARSVMIWSAISGILLVLYFIWMVKLLPVTAWMRFFKMIRHAHSQKCSVLIWGAWRCTSTSSLASTVTHFKYHCITVVSLWEQGEKQISYIICQATRRIVVQYSARDHSELTRVYSKEDTTCVTGKWWPNYILIKKCVSFTVVSVIFVHPLYILPS